MNTGSYHTKFQASADNVPDGKLSASVLLSPASFSYALSTNQFKNVVEIHHQVFEKTESHQQLNDTALRLIQNVQLHQKKLDKIQIALLNTEFTMVPEAFSFAQDTKTVLEFATGSTPAQRPQKHRVQQLDFFYGIHSDLATSLERFFPNVALRHAGAVCIQLLFSHHSLAHTNIFLQVSDGFIELAAKNQRTLLFYNVFSYQTNEDILYYLLFMMEQFGLNPLTSSLSLAGERPAQDELFKSIKKYIKQVSYCVPDKTVQLHDALSSLPAHYYFTLLNQHLCEL